MLKCTVVAIGHTNFCYNVCSICEKTLPENNISSYFSSSTFCKYCNFNNSFNFGSFSSKRLFCVLVASVLFGCSADEFFDLAKVHPFAAVNLDKVLEGEMLRATLSKPKNGNAASVSHFSCGSLVFVQQSRP